QAASVTLTGLPNSGNWTSTQNPNQTTINGSGTTYTVTGLSSNTTYSWSVTNANGCTSDNSNNVTINASPTLSQPTITTTNATCSSNGSSSISNYDVNNTYTFSPVGATVDNNGNISGMTVGTSYTVTATQGSCTSTASTSFSNSAQLTAPAIPTINIVSATCNANGSASISNYDVNNTYTFLPVGATVDNNGNISGMTVGTSYTVTANNGSCVSGLSNAFMIDGQTPAPTAPTVTSPQSFCGSAIVSNLTPATSDYKWYTVANGGTFLNSGDAVSSGTYYVSQMIGNCESERVAVVVVINPIPNVTVSPNTTICIGTTASLIASGSDSYTWSPTNENGSVITVNPTATITYTVTGTTSANCNSTASVTITVLNKPVASFIASNESDYVPFNVNFTNTSSNATSYKWSMNNTHVSSATNFTNNFENEGNYVVTLIASNGVCSDTTSKTIHAMLLPPPTVNIPNVFTPNGDGSNDEFFIDAQGAKDISVEIFNRWGNIVYKLNSLTDKWDGKNASDGTYFYKYKLTD
ncbi:MAG TPA: gliding motility-associated C-terminal domain-containing protein, partial [Crocinitomicaceae bacterium]|nr:gliding motility-associated C-terminal domain-containing protein [Crocinitomicaceae bacterium]